MWFSVNFMYAEYYYIIPASVLLSSQDSLHYFKKTAQKITWYTHNSNWSPPR